MVLLGGDVISITIHEDIGARLYYYIGIHGTWRRILMNTTK